MSATDETGGGSAASGAAALAWLRTADGVLIGLNHTLGNRLISLFTLSSLAADDDVADQLTAVAEEAERLDALLQLYRLMESCDGTETEAMTVADALGDAVLLLGQHSGLRDVACAVTGEAATPPVLLSRGALTQALLLLLCAAARQVVSRAATEGIVARYTGDATRVAVTVETREAVGADAGEEPFEFAAVRWLMGDAGELGGVTLLPDGRWSVSLGLESLSARRAREKRG